MDPVVLSGRTLPLTVGFDIQYTVVFSYQAHVEPQHNFSIDHGLRQMLSSPFELASFRSRQSKEIFL